MAFSFAENTLSLGDNGDGTWNVDYSSDGDIAGFQFNVDGAAITSASGGAAADSDFAISTGNNFVIAFSFVGATIPAGDGVLVVLDLTGTPEGLSGIIFSNTAGNAMDFPSCITIDGGSGDMDECGICGGDGPDCAGECNGSAVEDECGICNGDGIVDGACDCDGSVEDCSGVCGGIVEIDCTGVCGGDAVEDVCGECGGDGSSCSTTIDILYDSDTPIAGFQFDIDGVDLLGASGGAAEESYFLISTSGNTVIGNSSAGSLIEPGTGILVQVQVQGIGDPCLGNVIFSDANINSEDFESGFGSFDWDFSCTGFGCSNWNIDNAEFNNGAGSAKSGSINDDQSSDMSITIDIAADGEIEFYYRVSAEYSPSGTNFYDGLEFYIDDILKGQYQSTALGGSPWTYVSHDVTEGEHTFRWSYVKDGGVTCNAGEECEDAAWVDDIVFPTTALGYELDVCLEVVIISGCTDSEACNYDSSATNNDGTCTYPEENYDCDGNCIAKSPRLPSAVPISPGCCGR